LVSRLTVLEKIGLLPHNQQAIERFGIGELKFGTEVARGFMSREKDEVSTVFPQPIGLASTFNPDLMYELGEVCGTETRIYNKKYDYNKLMVWGPTVDLCRDPRWGRNEESYGEDPFLTGEMSTAYCKGMVGQRTSARKLGQGEYLRVLCGLKHFCCNNHEEDRTRDSANVDLRLLREYYYSAFEPAIKAKAAHSLMTAYNELSGVPGMLNRDIKRVCKKEWGMLFAVTDGGDFCQNVFAHKYSDNHAETLSLALKAGQNIMTEYNVDGIVDSAKTALKQGLITEKELDLAISETLTGRFMLGEFDPPEMCPYNNYSDELLNCDEHKAVTARAARECITLLKNDGLLPLKNDEKITVAVIGLLANSSYKDWYTGMSSYNTTILSGLQKALGEENVSYHDGCDIVAIKSALTGKYLQVKSDGSVVADSVKVTKACQFKKIDWDYEAVYVSVANGKLLYLAEDDVEAPLSQTQKGFINATGNDTYEWFGRMIIRPEYNGTYKSWRNKDLAIDENGRLCEVEGSGVTQEKLFYEKIVVDGVAKSTDLAEKADYAIVCVGNDPMVPARECFDRKSLELPMQQSNLCASVSSFNKNTVMVITASYPYTLDYLEVPAIVYTAHGGPEAGDAMADVLLGKYNPAGRTCQTWYKSEYDLPSIKDYDIMTSGTTYQYFCGEALYPFGHGLSYSKFEYSDFEVKDTGDDIEVTVKVRNTSKIYGEEVVQLYFTALGSRVKRPKKQLCEFIRQGIEAGKTVTLEFVFSKERLRFWDTVQNKFTVETGEYRFAVGASSSDIRETVTLKIKGEKIPKRNMGKLTPAVNYDDKREIELRYDRKSEHHYVHAHAFNGSSAIEFYDVDLCLHGGNVTDATGIEVHASIDARDGVIGVFVNDKQVGEILVAGAACPTEFKKHKIKFKRSIKGKAKLTLRLSQYINLMDIKLT
jgi:beta-glucosidase